MKRPVWAGTRSRVSRLTTTIVTRAAGTLQAAGWPSSTATHPVVVLLISVQPTATPEPSPPTSSPATAPGAVSPRHQMPSSSRGQNVDAATAKARPTVRATPTLGLDSAMTHGTVTASTAPTRKAATPPSRRTPGQRPVTSWLSTPATAIASPDEVERNAANAPAVTSPVSISPVMPGTISRGSSRTSTSLRPEATSSSAYTRPRAA